MAKKINSSNKCLALTTLWVNQFQLYNKFSFFSKNEFFLLFIIKFLIIQLNFTKNLITKTQSLIFSTQLLLIFSLVSMNNDFFLKLYQLFIGIWNRNFSSRLSFFLLFYVEKNHYLSAQFLKSYILYLITDNVNSPKKIFNLLVLLLTKTKNQSIISISKSGFRKITFIGFKIQLKGRYESTKNEMSNYLFIKDGKNNSTNLNITIDFINHLFYTKLGISNLKIWLFYSTKF
uniref:Ribosomal protein S3 n=1 Tax=Symphyocladia marchantioides TaxID=88360 RepID=UPI0022FD8B5B|nr:Ribosomal protein S3 [Symphyocladia marchantioides]WAX04041.1 Ribosomal protein S3 [Symphyocladia marchantioides]